MNDLSLPSVGATRRRSGGRVRAVFLVVAMIAAVLVVPSTPLGAQTQTVVNVGPGQSIQAAIDAAAPGTTIIVRGAHRENLWINKSGISLIGRGDASITAPANPTPNPCSNPAPNTPEQTLICVQGNVPPTGGPPETLSNVSITGFTLRNSSWDAIAFVFVNNVRVNRNTIANPGCDGVFVIFARGFQIQANNVSRAECAGINVVGSIRGSIRNNTTTAGANNGINVNDTSRVVIDRNRSFGNCIGIGVGDGPDGGFGVFARDRPTRNIEITRNVTSRNNRLCFPFGPDAPIGVTGILVAGAQNVRLVGNAARNNASTEFTLTAAGILVTDFPDPEDLTAVFSVTANASVIRNAATGNEAADELGAIVGGDLVLTTEGTLASVRSNRCEFGVPNQEWCG